MAATPTQAPGFYRFPLGAFQAIALHDGSLTRDRPPGFVPNAPDDAVADAFASIGLPRDKLTITFTALALETPSGTILIDTGLGDNGPPGTGLLVSNLAAAGIAPDAVTHVLISHFHGDHISGLRAKDGTLTFPAAQLLAPQPEWDFWMDDARMQSAPEAMKGNFALCRRMFGDAPVRRFAWNDEVLPGITALPAPGHTPGMTTFAIQSEGQRMLFAADITNSPALFVRHPDWQAAFDMDPAATIATRRRILDQAAQEHLLLAFFHAPFPGLGYVVKTGPSYEYLPALWRA